MDLARKPDASQVGGAVKPLAAKKIVGLRAEGVPGPQKNVKHGTQTPKGPFCA